MRLAPPITSRSNPRVKALRAAFSGNARRPGDLLGIEGETLLIEAAQSGLQFETIFVRQGSEDALTSLQAAGVDANDFVALSRDAFDSAVGTQSPQGVAGLLAIPPVMLLGARATPGIFLMLEDVQDPGNVGTLIRSAEAFGARAVYITPNSANPWNPKTVRASAGSVFRMKTFTVTVAEFSAAMKQAGIRVHAGVAAAPGAIEVGESDLAAPCALMIGNEGAGLSAAALATADESLYIPCAVESLNAAIAGSVLLFEAARQNAGLVHPKTPGHLKTL